MVRLLSLVIVLLVPNLFAPLAPRHAARHRQAPPKSAPTEYLVQAGPDRVPAKAGWLTGDPDLAQRVPVPARVDPMPADPDPGAHPTFEPSFER
jgi:hypothetical protein